MLYRITSDGMDYGAYEGASREQAIDAMHRDAGYLGTEGCAAELGTTVEALRETLTLVAIADCPYCGREMPIGDEGPEERVCDTCAEYREDADEEEPACPECGSTAIEKNYDDTTDRCRTCNVQWDTATRVVS